MDWFREEKQLREIIITTLRNGNHNYNNDVLIDKMVEISKAQLYGHWLLNIAPEPQQLVDAIMTAFKRMGLEP